MNCNIIILFQAIYELACGEEDLVKDLLMIQKNYADPLVQLHILTSQEVCLFHSRLDILRYRRRFKLISLYVLS